jgi:flagellar protein FliS
VVTDAYIAGGKFNLALYSMLEGYSTTTTAVHGKSPLQVVVMLYDNALTSMRAGKVAIVVGDGIRRDTQIERSEQILNALMNCLDVRSGDMAVDLRTLYCYVLNELSEAKGDVTTTRLERCELVMKDLRKVWLELEASITPDAGFGHAIAA